MENDTEVTRARIIVVGDSHYPDDARHTTELVRKLIEAGCEACVVAPGDVMVVGGHSRLQLDQNIFELVGHPIKPHVPVLLDQSDRMQPHGWYQQFAGRRGRPPRY